MSLRNRPVRALIVDDEPLAVEGIRMALDSEAGIEVVGSCGDGTEAVDAIRRLQPDLVFLDIQMPGLDGFDVIETIGPDRMPAVVFVTAYDEHALRAFEVHAVDYLLKPFDDHRLRSCLAHAVARVRPDETPAETLADLLATVREEVAPPRYASRIMVRERDRIFFVETGDVDWFQAAGNYVRIHSGADRHLIRHTLSGLEERLDPRQFVRIHRSTIVNLRRVRELRPEGGGDMVAVLDSGDSLRVTRTYRDNVLRPLV